MGHPEEPEGKRETENEPGLRMSEKVVRLHEALQRAAIPHAFGGAIAVDYYRVPRTTVDIDLNVFVSSEERDRVIEVLAEEFDLPDREALSAEIAKIEQGKTYWGGTRIDIFFAASEFNESMAERVRVVEYQGGTIPILSAEDILVIKAVFDRSQDWLDIDAVCKVQGDKLDLAYMTKWLGKIIGVSDPRVTRLVQLVEAQSKDGA